MYKVLGESRMGVTIVIPAYNEEQRIKRVINEVTPYADEILVIDDCSKDNTAQAAKEMNVRVLSHNVNKGHKEAIKTGFHAASHDIIVTIDADGEYPADQIPKLLQPLKNGIADVVTGKRQSIPRISEQILTHLARLRLNVSDTGSGLKALRANIAKQLELPGECICGIFLLEAARKGGGRIQEVTVKRRRIAKQKKPAWHHFLQFFYVLRELLLSLLPSTSTQ